MHIFCKKKHAGRFPNAFKFNINCESCFWHYCEIYIHKYMYGHELPHCCQWSPCILLCVHINRQKDRLHNYRSDCFFLHWLTEEQKQEKAHVFQPPSSLPTLQPSDSVDFRNVNDGIILNTKVCGICCLPCFLSSFFFKKVVAILMSVDIFVVEWCKGERQQ